MIVLRLVDGNFNQPGIMPFALYFKAVFHISPPRPIGGVAGSHHAAFVQKIVL